MALTAIQTKYIGPSNRRASRMVATASDGIKARVSVAYNHSLDQDGNHRIAAKALAEKLGWDGEWYGGATRQGMIFVRYPNGYNRGSFDVWNG